jgi:hypothetical protein
MKKSQHKIAAKGVKDIFLSGAGARVSFSAPQSATPSDIDLPGVNNRVIGC